MSIYKYAGCSDNPHTPNLLTFLSIFQNCFFSCLCVCVWVWVCVCVCHLSHWLTCQWRRENVFWKGCFKGHRVQDCHRHTSCQHDPTISCTCRSRTGSPATRTCTHTHTQTDTQTKRFQKILRYHAYKIKLKGLKYEKHWKQNKK